MLNYLLDTKQNTPITELTKEEALELQQALDILDFNPGPIDGIVGPKTSQAFDKFKSKHYLGAKGLMGGTTLAVLLVLLDAEDDTYEDDNGPHPNQPNLSEPYTFDINSINWSDYNSPVSKYFSVGEVTQWDSRRIPTRDNIKANILKLAKRLDAIREAWGSGIGVTSWYRPASPINVNAQVGGVRKSSHIQGFAVDIYPINGQTAKFERWLDIEQWPHNPLGYGQRSGRGFTHIDLRPNRARWNY